MATLRNRKSYINQRGEVEKVDIVYKTKFWEEVDQWMRTQDHIHPSFLIQPNQYEIIPNPIEFNELTSSHPWFQLTSGAMKLISNGWRLPDTLKSAMSCLNYHTDAHYEISQPDLDQYENWVGESQGAVARFAALVHYLKQKEGKELSLPFKPHLGTDSYRNLLNYWSHKRSELSIKKPNKAGLNTRKNNIEKVPEGFAEWCFKYLCDQTEALNLLAKIICGHLNYAQDSDNYIEYEQHQQSDEYDPNYYYTVFKSENPNLRFYTRLQEWEYFQRKFKFPKFKESHRTALQQFFKSCQAPWGPSLTSEVRGALEYLKENPDKEWVFDKAERKKYIKYYEAMVALQEAITEGRSYLKGIGEFASDIDKFWDSFITYKKHQLVEDEEIDLDVLKADYTLVVKGVKLKKEKHLKELTEAEKKLRAAEAEAAKARAQIDSIRAKLSGETKPNEVSNVKAQVLNPDVKHKLTIDPLGYGAIGQHTVKHSLDKLSEIWNTPITQDMMKVATTPISPAILSKYLTTPSVSKVTSTENMKALEQKGKDIDAAKSSGKLDEYKKLLGGGKTCKRPQIVAVLRPGEKVGPSNQTHIGKEFVKKYKLVPTNARPRTEAESLIEYLKNKKFGGNKKLKEASVKAGHSGLITNTIKIAGNPETPFKKILKDHFQIISVKEQNKEVDKAKKAYPPGELIAEKGATYDTTAVALALCEEKNSDT